MRGYAMLPANWPSVRKICFGFPQLVPERFIGAVWAICMHGLRDRSSRKTTRGLNFERFQNLLSNWCLPFLSIKMEVKIRTANFINFTGKWSLVLFSHRRNLRFEPAIELRRDPKFCLEPMITNIAAWSWGANLDNKRNCPEGED